MSVKKSSPMAKPTVTHIPAELRPKQSSTELIDAYLQRHQDHGNLQKAVASALDVNPNNLSQWRKGQNLIPMTKLRALADILELSAKERCELIHARFLELNGWKAEVCLETFLEWARDMLTSPEQEAVWGMWSDVSKVAPFASAQMLHDPVIRARLQAAMADVVQEVLAADAAEAA